MKVDFNWKEYKLLLFLLWQPHIERVVMEFDGVWRIKKWQQALHLGYINLI